MQFILNIEKKHFYLIAVMVALVGVVSFVQSQGGSTPNPGHDANSISINIGGNFMSLQDAVDNGTLAPQPNGCSWEGVMCSCSHDTGGSTEGEAIVGIKCESGVITDVIFKNFHVTSGNANCPGSYSGCDIYQIG